MYLSDHFSPGRLLPQKCLTTPSELRKVLFLTPSVCGIFCFWMNISGTAERICVKFTRKTFGPSVGQGQGHQGQKTAFFGPFEVK